MSNILLFFMSAYKPDIKNGAYSRAQTNETVLYELQKQKERRPDTVLALCSASVRNAASVPAPDGGEDIIRPWTTSGSRSCPQPGSRRTALSPSPCPTA